MDGVPNKDALDGRRLDAAKGSVPAGRVWDGRTDIGLEGLGLVGRRQRNREPGGTLAEDDRPLCE